MGISHTRKRLIRLEIAAWTVAILGALWIYRTPLFLGTSILSHDNLILRYPAFHFFVENFLAGHIPWWDPYHHGGEPFFPMLLQYRLLDPQHLLTLLIASRWTQDTVLLFHWERAVDAILMAIGAYLLLRRNCTRISMRVLLILTLLFSSFTLASFRQFAFLYQFLWIPYIALLLKKVLRGTATRASWLLLLLLIGLNFQTYWFVGTILFVTLFIGGWCLARNRLSTADLRFRVLSGVTILLVASLPNLVLLKEMSQLHLTVRALPPDYESLPNLGGPYQFELPPQSAVSSPFLKYSAVEFGGAFLSPWDVIQALAPGGNRYLQGVAPAWGSPSEAFLFIGHFGWILTLLGIFFGKSRWKTPWFCVWLGHLLVMLGPNTSLYRILFSIFPPLWIVRHTNVFISTFTLASLYFSLLGAKRLVGASRSVSWRKVLPTSKAFALSIAGLYLYVALVLLTLENNFTLPVTPKTLWLVVIIIPLLVARFTWASLAFGSSLIAQTVTIILYARPFPILSVSAIVILTLLWFLASRRFVSRSAVALLLMLFASTELFLGFRHYRFLFEGIPHPSHFLSVDTKIHRYELPETRRSSPIYHPPKLEDPRLEQTPRQLSALYRVPSLFSVPAAHALTENHSFSEVRQAQKFNGHYLHSRYAKEIYSDIDDDTLMRRFRIGQSLLYSCRPPCWLPADERPASIKVLESSPNGLRAQVTFKESSWLVFSDMMESHWSGLLNGKSQNIIPVHDVAKAMPLEAGTNEIEFRYFPKMFAFALGLVGAVYSLILCWLLWSAIPSRLPTLRIAAPLPTAS